MKSDGNRVRLRFTAWFSAIGIDKNPFSPQHERTSAAMFSVLGVGAYAVTYDATFPMTAPRHNGTQSGGKS